MKTTHSIWVEKIIAVVFISFMFQPGLIAEEKASSANSGIRTYNHAVQMHEAPVERMFTVAPETKNRTIPGQKDFFSEYSFQPESTLPMGGYPLYNIPPPLPLEKKDKDKNKLWLLPDSSDAKKGEEEVKPSGWGWLADNMLKIQRVRENGQTEDSLTQEQQDFSLTAMEKEKASEPNAPSIQASVIQDVPYEPVPTEALAPPQAGTLSSPDSLLAGQVAVDKRPPAAQLSFGAPATDMKSAPANISSRETASGFDRLWGPDQTRSQREEPSAALPQTAQLLREITHPKEAQSSSGAIFPSPSLGSDRSLQEPRPSQQSTFSSMTTPGMGYRPAFSESGSSFSPVSTRESSFTTPPGGAPALRTQPLQPMAPQRSVSGSFRTWPDR